jgi:hypothetical protein
MALAASESFSISTNANPRERPVSRSVMMRALFTAPYLSNRLRTDSSVELKLRLPTKIFFTLSTSKTFGKRAHREGTLAEDTRLFRYRTHSHERAVAYQTRIEYTTGAGRGEGESPRGRFRMNTLQTEKPPRLTSGAFSINRATSYSPTQLPVQYHRG